MVRIPLLKADELWFDPADQFHELAIQIDKGLVPVLRNGQPRVAVAGRKTRPAPLAPVPVRIADEKIDEPRLEIGPGVQRSQGDSSRPSYSLSVPLTLREPAKPGSSPGASDGCSCKVPITCTLDQVNFNSLVSGLPFHIPGPVDSHGQTLLTNGA